MTLQLLLRLFHHRVVIGLAFLTHARIIPFVLKMLWFESGHHRHSNLVHFTVSPPKRKHRGVEPERDLHVMPVTAPVLPDEQYSLPEAVGCLFDSTVLSRDALRPLADSWCRLSEGNLL